MKKQNNTLLSLEEIRRKIRALAIKTKKRVSGILIGESKTKMLGQGLAFDSTREYQHGDDIRLIDWNAYARTQNLSTKQYTEDRKKNVCILFDISRSSTVETGIQSKLDVSKTALSVLMLAAAHHQDPVSAIAYADDVIHTTQAQSTLSGVYADLEKLLSLSGTSQDTRLETAAKTVVKRYKKTPLTLFIISDCIDHSLEKAIRHLASTYDVYIIRTLDPIELSLPALGLLPIIDIENESFHLLHTRNQKQLKEILAHRLQQQNRFFSRVSVPVLDLYSHDQNVIDTMIRFFITAERKS